MKYLITLMAIIGLAVAVLAANANPNNKASGKSPGTSNGCSIDLNNVSFLTLFILLFI